MTHFRILRHKHRVDEPFSVQRKHKWWPFWLNEKYWTTGDFCWRLQKYFETEADAWEYIYHRRRGTPEMKKPKRQKPDIVGSY